MNKKVNVYTLTFFLFYFILYLKGGENMVDIINLISQNGIAIVCVAYLIYFQLTTMKSMLKTLSSINKRLTIIEDTLEIKKEERSSSK